MLEQELIHLCLSEKEAVIYMASLELGPSTIQEISHKSGIIRTTGYNLIQSLIEKGLMTELHKGKRRLFVGQSPERLLSLIRVQKKELEERERGLKAILPELKGLIDFSRFRPKIRFYDGKQAIRLMRDDILSMKNLDCIEEFVPLDDAYQFFPAHKRDHRLQMLKALNRTQRKVIYTSKKGMILPARERLVERRFVPLAKFPLLNEINIYGNKVGIVSYQKRPMGLIMEGKEVAQSLRSIFYLAWRGSRS